jgi:hypothetical protein
LFKHSDKNISIEIQCFDSELDSRFAVNRREELLAAINWDQ